MNHGCVLSALGAAAGWPPRIVSTCNGFATADAGFAATARRGAAFTSGAATTGAFATGVVVYVPAASCDSETEVLSVLLVSPLLRSTK
jgi:hypothetical protein